MVVLEAAAIIGLVGWVAAPTFTLLVGKVQSYTVNKYKLRKGLQKKLETLSHLLDEIGSTVSLVEAAGRINNHNMVCWLSQLKDAIYEVVDILDMLDCDIIAKSNQLVDPAAEPSAGSIGSAESLKRLEKLLKKLDDIRQSSRGVVQASMLAVTMAAGCSGTSRPVVTGPLLPMESLGYDDMYKLLLTWLVPDMKILQDGSYNDRDVVAIIGHGGMGKTTLAQRALSDPGVKKRFDLVIWASVHNKFSEADLLGEIWRSAAGTQTIEDGGSSRQHGEMSFGSIQQALEKLVASSKRYLLVLDDVCNDETATDLQRREAWSHVLAPFRRGCKRGSRILVTTRAFICAKTLGAGCDRRITLDGVDRESFIKLLKRNVEPRSKDLISEFLRSSTLISEPEERGRKRSPLSAKEIGLKLTNTSSKNKWAKILTTDCHENVISAHVSSYQQLPRHLQHCLAFLSLFPNNFKFRPEMLVKLWVAHGFIISDERDAMEETATQYFNELVLRSFLQHVDEKGNTNYELVLGSFLQSTEKKGKINYYVIHEQIHSMIRFVSTNYFMMIQGNHAATKIPPTVRHLSVTTSYLPQLKNPSVLKKLRTFLVFKDSSPALTAIDKDLLRELNGIRVMDLTGTDIADLPPEIGNLIHLRYLALPYTIQILPQEFSKLYHLQALIGRDHAQTAGLEQLTFKFRTNKKTSLEQLACMDSLRSLAITGLDVVATKEDAQKGQLKNKKSLKVMKLEWKAEVAISDSDLDVLEGLEPHSGLQVLHIRRYRGTSSPSWLANNHLIQLTRLYIINCRKWKVLPPFGHLPHLNHLDITEAESVEQIDGNGLFKSLETLVLSDLVSLVEWTLLLKTQKFGTVPVSTNHPHFHHVKSP